LRRLITRRVLAVAGAAAIGTIGALTIPGAASAHHTTTKFKVDCVGDTATVTWLVTNSQTNIEAKVTGLKSSQGTIVKSTKAEYSGYTVLAVGATLKKANAPQAQAVGQVTVPASAGTVTLGIDTEWDYNKNADKKQRTKDVVKAHEDATARWSKDQCSEAPQQPSATFESNCDGTVTVVITNPTGKDAEFVVKSQTTDYKANVKVVAGKSEKVSVPKEHAADIKVAVKGDENGKALGKYKFTAPENCEDAEYTGSFEPSCDGVKVTLNNPADGETLKVTILANGQEKYKFEVAPGKSESKMIGRQDSVKVVVKVEGFEPDGEFDYTVPAGCGGSLPVTGVNAGLMAGGASVLVLGGAALFMMARRRRVQFTA